MIGFPELPRFGQLGFRIINIKQTSIVLQTSQGGAAIGFLTEAAFR
jgi:hypothetical protein